MLSRLIDAVRKLDCDPTPEVVAEALWMLQYLSTSSPAHQPTQPEESTDNQQIVPKKGNPQTTSTTELGRPQTSEPVRTIAVSEESESVELFPHIPSSSKISQGGVRLHLPSASSLDHRQELIRALRPLARRVLSHSTFVLDEDETIQRLESLDLFLPALQPLRERWMSLHLVFDRSSSMDIWWKTLDELKEIFFSLGIFRNVRLWAMFTEGLILQLAPLISVSKISSQRLPAALVDPSGRSIVIVVTDCVSAAWQDGSVARALNIWGQVGPVTILQVLPERLWIRSALRRMLKATLYAGRAGLPNQSLGIYAPASALMGSSKKPRGIPIPVLPIEPKAILSWTRMIAGVTNERVPGYVFSTEVHPNGSASNTSTESLSSERRLKRFLAHTSPQGVDLARLVAAAPLVNQPIIRYIQQTMPDKPHRSHLVEFFLGGLLTPVSRGEHPESVLYDFIGDTRKLLLSQANQFSTASVYRSVSQYLAQRTSLSRSFGVTAAVPDGVSGQLSIEAQQAFASATVTILRDLGYREFADTVRMSAMRQGFLFASGHALLVEVEDYPQADSKEITSKGFDVRAIAEALSGSQGCRYPRNQVTLLSGREATRHQVLAELERLANTVDKSDIIFIYLDLSWINDYAGKLVLETSEVVGKNELIDPNLGIRTDDLVKAIQQLKAHRCLIALQMRGTTINKSFFTSLIGDKRDYMILTDNDATDDLATQLAKGSSVFAEAISKAFSGKGIIDRGGFISVLDLFMRVRELAWDLARERHYVTQTPMLIARSDAHPFPIGLHPNLLGAPEEFVAPGLPENEVLLIEPIKPQNETRSARTETYPYTTAKIVLVGDSGVGKTSLGWRLAHGEFKGYASSHNQQFWVVDDLSVQRSDGTECEAVLWELAGQHVYRSVHAIFLNNVDLALVLFDPTNRQDPLKGAEFWLEHLRGKGELPPTVLVGARVDRGAPVLSQSDIEQFCRRYGVSGYVSTSAMTGEGVAALLDTLKTLIPWDELAATVTTITFKRIKDYVLSLKQQPDRTGVLVRAEELRRLLQASDSQWHFDAAEMMTAVGHLETHGYVAVLPSSAGNRFILLRPEQLIDLASSIFLLADRHPRELGALDETKLLQGDYALPELSVLTKTDQAILLDVVLARFLDHNLCFRETLGPDTLLIFPSLIKQKRPLNDLADAIDDISYIVRGQVENVYAALVVLLGYTPTFKRINQWQRQAQYELGPSQICGFRLLEEREGEIELVLYYSPTMPTLGRELFHGLFEQFLYQRDVYVQRIPLIICLNGHRQERATAIKRVREGKRFLFCEECGARVDLPEIEKPSVFGARTVGETRLNQAQAQLRSLYEIYLVNVKGFRRDRAAPRAYISHVAHVVDQAKWAEELARDLREAGVLVLEDRAEIQLNDALIVICSPEYKAAWGNLDRLVADDAKLVRAHLKQPDDRWPPVIPLVQKGLVEDACPLELRDLIIGNFRDETRYVIDLFDLVLTLYAIPIDHPTFAPLRENLRRQWADALEHAPQEREESSAEAKVSGLKIFISYAHDDEKFKDELVTMLASMQRRGVIDAWQDRRIEPGDEWYRAIQAAMRECDMALLLVSATFLASPFIQDEELPRLLQRRKDEGMRVIPIIIRDCPWQSEPVLNDLQALPRDGKPVITFRKSTGERDRVWTEIVQKIESIVTAASAK